FLQTLARDADDIGRSPFRRMEALAGEPDNIAARAALIAYFHKRGNKDYARGKMEALLREDVREDEDYPRHFALGKLFYDGILSPEERDYGLELIERAAAAGNAQALLTLGDRHAASRQYPQAIRYYRK